MTSSLKRQRGLLLNPFRFGSTLPDNTTSDTLSILSLYAGQGALQNFAFDYVAGSLWQVDTTCDIDGLLVVVNSSGESWRLDLWDVTNHINLKSQTVVASVATPRQARFAPITVTAGINIAATMRRMPSGGYSQYGSSASTIPTGVAYGDLTFLGGTYRLSDGEPNATSGAGANPCIPLIAP